MERGVKKRRWILVLAAVLAFSGLGPADAGKPDPLEEWGQGPVRYLMTRAEYKEWKKLKNPSDRVDFIRNFWRRRDPDLRTPENEARARFWRRVADANRQFEFGGMPGWKTDRGKMYILLGPPEDIDTKENYDTGERSTAARGLMRWKYTGLPNAALRANTVVAFVRGSDGDWHLTDDAQLTSPFFDINSPIEEQYTTVAGVMPLLEQVPWAGSNLSTAMDLGRLQEVPSEQEILRAAVKAEGFLGTYSGAWTWHTLTGAQGQRLVALTVAIPRSDLQPPWDGSAIELAQRFAVSGDLRGVGGAADVAVDIPEAAWMSEPAPAPGDLWLRFQTVQPAPDAPGWRFSAVVADRRGGGAAVVRGDISAPSHPAGAPRLNGPILAVHLEHTPAAETPGTLPFHFGEALLVPKIGDQYRPDEPFTLFIEVLPPADAPAPVILDWRFERTAPGAATPETWGKPGHLPDARGPRAWEVKAGMFPPGRYNVSFTARTEAGPAVERSVSFTIAAPAGGPEAPAAR